MWLEVELRRPGQADSLIVRAYANGGFRAGEPEIILPPRLATLIGFDMEQAELGEGIACGGTHIAMWELGEIEIRVHVPDREVPWVRAKAVCIEGEYEALLSRELIGSLGLLLDYGRGRWRLEDDPPGKYRDEAEPQYWR